jgi:hypothetical protein
MAAATNDDGVTLARWWQVFRDTGALPTELELVQGRLVRAVHRGCLPSGPVHVKTMAFPRSKDRLRYALRALPAAHEAAMLRRTAAAGIPCPEVVGAFTARRAGLPFRSMLVLRTMPTVQDAEHEATRLRDEAALAGALVTAGIEHEDLHRDNFLRLPDGRLAVLDLQSARRCRPGSMAARRRMASRLVRDLPDEALDALVGRLVAAGLLVSDDEREGIVQGARTARRRFLVSRVRRCLGESTEFERRVTPTGIEHRRRDAPVAVRCHRGGRRLVDAWLGERVLQVLHDAAPSFGGIFRKWWWLGGGASLYVPAEWSDERTLVEVERCAAAFDRFRAERS